MTHVQTQHRRVQPIILFALTGTKAYTVLAPHVQPIFREFIPPPVPVGDLGGGAGRWHAYCRPVVYCDIRRDPVCEDAYLCPPRFRGDRPSIHTTGPTWRPEVVEVVDEAPAVVERVRGRFARGRRKRSYEANLFGDDVIPAEELEFIMDEEGEIKGVRHRRRTATERASTLGLAFAFLRGFYKPK